ncbi:MAG: DUF4912 domain-containing protein [Nitrospirota bacterium]
MNKSDIRKLRLSEMIDLAGRHGISLAGKKTRAQVMEALSSLETDEETIPKSGADTPETSPQKPGEQPSRKETRETQVSVMQQAVEESKYYTGQPEAGIILPSELPYYYDEDRIVLLMRDPYWAYSYWEVTQKKLEMERGYLGEGGRDAYLALRLYDVTDIIFNGANDHGHYDIGIYDRIGNWYINTGMPGRSFVVDLGLKTQDGRFITLARSNVAKAPADAASSITDEEWVIGDQDFERIFAQSGGYSSSIFGTSSAEVRLAAGQRVPFGVSSPGMGSLALMSPIKKRERSFWFILNTELIVYGATEPDASVTVQGRPVTLRPDGTFTLRFALPDGTQDIPVSATSADGVETRWITPQVKRKTSYS